MKGTTATAWKTSRFDPATFENHLAEQKAEPMGIWRLQRRAPLSMGKVPSEEEPRLGHGLPWPGRPQQERHVVVGPFLWLTCRAEQQEPQEDAGDHVGPSERKVQSESQGNGRLLFPPLLSPGTLSVSGGGLERQSHASALLLEKGSLG